MMRNLKVLEMAVFVLCAGVMFAPAQTVVYEDDFSSTSPGGYTSFSFESEADTLVEFGYDFGSTLNGYGDPIPSAPNSVDGDTLALLLSANILPSPDNKESYVGVYTPESFSGDYQVYVDFYCNTLGPNGSGTTNHMTVGINASGEKNNNFYQWYGGTGSAERELAEDSDGYMFSAAFDDGDGSRDYGMTEGTPGIRDWYLGVEPGNSDADPPLLAVLPDYAPTWFAEELTQGWQARADGTEPSDIYNSPDALTQTLFEIVFTDFGDPPADINQAPANAWHELRIDYIDGVVTIWIRSSTVDFEAKDAATAAEVFPWLQIDEEGFIKIVEYDDPDDTWTFGKIFLGFEDGFASPWGDAPVAGVERLQYVLYDNLKVVQIGEPADVANWSLF